MRDFDVDAPNTAWVTDITYLATLEGWLYLAVILDLFSRRVVGYAMSERVDRALVLEALRKALVQRPGVRDLVHHSDRGSQYASHDYRDALDQAGIMCSMSRRGDCWDNAVAESFFGTLKVELLYELPLQTRSATRSAVDDYIETFYNVRRRHSSLGYQSPAEFELKNGVHGGFAPVPVRPTAHNISGVRVPIRAEALRPGIRTQLRSREAWWRAGGGERMARRRTNAIRPHGQVSWRVQAKPTLQILGR
jgi:hypothetical protein